MTTQSGRSVCGVETVQGCFFVTRPNTDRIFKICGGGAMVVVYIPWSMVYHGIPWWWYTSVYHGRHTRSAQLPQGRFLAPENWNPLKSALFAALNLYT